MIDFYRKQTRCEFCVKFRYENLKSKPENLLKIEKKTLLQPGRNGLNGNDGGEWIFLSGNTVGFFCLATLAWMVGG